MPRNLVIVRAGDQSLHEAWAKPGGAYDLVVSYYGNDPERFRKGALLRHDAKGGKLEGIHRLLTDHPLLLDCYDYVWMPDDDILIAPADLEMLFAAMPLYKVNAAQPALDAESYVAPSLRITAKHEGFRVRFTNFVEMMAPCLGIDTLRFALPHFKDKRFGWGVDWYWSRHIPPAAIIDAITMTHTRPPRTGPLYAEGNPELELQAFLKTIGWQSLPRPEVSHAILEDGTSLERRNPALHRKVRAAWGRLRTKSP